VYDNLGSIALLGALAALTDGVRLGTCVLLPFLHHPLVLAKELASIDQASGGRLTLGLGIGSRGVDYAAASLPNHDRGRRMDETLELLRQAWSGQPIDHHGALFDIHVPPIGPRPAQERLPIWLSGRSRPAMARAAREADGFILGRGSPAFHREWLADLRQELEAAERDPRTLPTACLVFFGPTPAAVATHLRRYYAEEPWRMDPAQDGIHGSPRQAAEQLRRYAELGFDTLIGVPTSLDLEDIDRLAEATGMIHT
jgi:probable F420-dependent oxidoreductase